MATLQFGGFQPINVDDNLLSGLRTSIQSGEKTTQQAIEDLVGSFESQVQSAGGIGSPGGETAISSLGFNQNTFAQFLGARDPNTPISASLKAVLEGKEQPTQYVPGSLEGTPEVVQGTAQPVQQQTQQQSSQGGVVNPPLPDDYLQRLQAQGGQVQGGQVSPTAQYVEVNGAYFQQTPQGLTVVNDPNILRGLKTGQIKSSSGSLGSQQITGVSAPEMLPASVRNATPEQGLQVVAQSNPQLAQDIQKSLGFTGTPSELDSRLAPMAQSNPVKFVSDIFGEIFKNLGLSDVKSQFETFNKKIEDLTNDMNDEISDINDNPWLTEGVRQRQIRKVQEKYSGRIDSATASARLMQGFYDDGLQQAQWATGQALNIYNKEVDFQNQLYREALDRAEKRELALFEAEIEASQPRTLGAGSSLVDPVTGQIIVTAPRASGTSTGTTSSLVPQVLDGFQKIGDLTPSQKTAVKSELFGMGFGSDTPPQWFIEYIQEQLQMSLTPEAAKQEWIKYRDSILSEGGSDELDFSSF